MSIESNLPENQLKAKDALVFHWENAVRSIGTALEFASKAHNAYRTSPQIREAAICNLFSLLEMALRDQLTDAKRQAETAAIFADRAHEEFNRRLSA